MDRQYILAIDLGTTNFKFALYDHQIKLIALHKIPVVYTLDNTFVEFDPHRYIDDCLSGMRAVVASARIDAQAISLITLTGQAESFVLADAEGNVLGPGISWKDSRSDEEVDLLRDFAGDRWYHITGLPEVTTTWPVTKLLWLRRHERELYDKIARVFLLKDYVTWCLCGEFVTEYSVFSFSGLMNLSERRLWRNMQDHLGLSDSMVGRFEEAGTIVGTLEPSVARKLGMSCTTQICIGALDHVAGMVGTGNLAKGKVSVSMGTVNALALNISSFADENCQIECHSGYLPDSVIQLLVIESGGIGLQWFHDRFLPTTSFTQIDREVGKVLHERNDIIFLPYICGLNPPEYDPKARGVFYGFDLSDGPLEFARAVLEANGFLLRKSIEYLEAQTQQVTEIHAIGGSASSTLFCQMVADIIKKPVITFKEPESTTLGAALMGAVSMGLFNSIEDAVETTVERAALYTPHPSAYYEEKYRQFNALYGTLYPSGKGSM